MQLKMYGHFNKHLEPNLGERMNSDEWCYWRKTIIIGKPSKSAYSDNVLTEVFEKKMLR